MEMYDLYLYNNNMFLYPTDFCGFSSPLSHYILCCHFNKINTRRGKREGKSALTAQYVGRIHYIIQFVCS